MTLSPEQIDKLEAPYQRIRWWDLSERRGFPGSVALPGRGG
ncbi:hypothetical protein [Klebsiella pneumoniae IS53]|nr:hypothetical protein [Klebsiella pneumoniae IS53]